VVHRIPDLYRPLLQHDCAARSAEQAISLTAAAGGFCRDFCGLIVFSLFAAVRVLVFSAAFPFNNIDERRHFDLVIKYADGHVPEGAELISPATLPYLSHYASPEFLSAPEDFPGGYYGPMWKHPAEEVAPTIAKIEETRPASGPIFFKAV